MPEPQSLIPRSRHNRLSTRRHGQIQNSHTMPRESGDFSHRRISPHDDLVEGISVGGHDFVDCFGPHEVAYLTPGIDAVERGGSMGIPEPERVDRVC